MRMTRILSPATGGAVVDFSTLVPPGVVIRAYPDGMFEFVDEIEVACEVVERAELPQDETKTPPMKPEALTG